MYAYSNVGDRTSNRTVQADTNTLQQAVRKKIINDDKREKLPACIDKK